MINKRQAMLIQELTRTATELMKEWPTSRTKQRAFILEFVSNGFTNASEAVRNAGYSEKSASNTAHKRFLEGRFRKEFDLVGTPLRIEMKTSHNPFGDKDAG